MKNLIKLREAVRKLLLELGPSELLAADQLANLAHQGQTRRDGTPYIMHPTAVQAITAKYYPENIAAQVLSKLHDVIEDGPKYSGLTRRELFSKVKEAIPNNIKEQKLVMDALRIMTHSKRKHPNYENYLELVFSNQLAAIVKISDLIHNLSHNPSERQIKKYQQALQIVPIPSHIAAGHKNELERILDI